MEAEEQQMQQLMKKLQEKRKQSELKNKQPTTTPSNKQSTVKESRKKDPAQININMPAQINAQMDIEEKKVNKLKFQDLPEDVEFYITDIYDMDKKRLYLTGIMENGQSLSVITNQSWKQLYFVLKDEDPESFDMSESYLKRAEEEIRLRLHKIGLRENQYQCEIVAKQYVFQIEGIPRNVRCYCKVRYSFNQILNDEIEPTWEGETFKYVFGTTYTPLELLIINRGIKGPCWVTLKKQLLKQNTRDIANGLCVEIAFSESIEICQTKKEPPYAKVLSFSLKSVVPSQVSTKKYFPTQRKDETHIYAISYHFCEKYRVNIKEDKPHLIQRTYFLETLDRDNSKKDPFFKCKNEADMINRFLADVVRLDPDFIVCHDSSKILDTLVCRLPKIAGDRNMKNKFGRLNIIRDFSKTNQYQRINKFIAGRLLVDTYLHAKEMIKEIDYELATISTHVKNDKKFVGISDEEAKVYLSTDKPLLIINKCAQESELTFNLMNHLEIVQMTRQLSNICGNLWKRSLQNKRAQRNEYFIMHECFDRDLIIPDKFRKSEDEETEIKKKYQGGMVIEPKKGFKSDYILLLDFNSLYPSIIREYNVCFSAIERPKVPIDFYYRKKTAQKKIEKKAKGLEDDIVDDNPEEDELEQVFSKVKNCKSKQEWGFLPQIIDQVVERRKKCKNMMKKAKNASDKKILDIQQKCYKLVANSIYGCLGFSVSRFYSRPLAALITKKGRDSLIAARDIAMKRGTVDVIYGDTDSIMLEPLTLKSQEEITQAQKLKLLKKIADELKRQINSQYTFLQIDIDGIFKPLILLMKKKYVANKLTNFEEILDGKTVNPEFSLEYKGIELVRRDGCKIARDTQEDIIKILVKNNDTELDDRFNQIYDYFIKLKDSLRTKPKQHFLFSKQLSKNPKEYHNAENMPHVKVALDLVKAGQKEQSLVNHTIYYLICREKDKEYRMLSEQAFDQKNFQKIKKLQPQRQIEIDYEYYKEVVLQPVMRLLVSIDKDKVVIDRLSDALEIQRHRRKAIYDKCQDTEEISTEKFGEVICQSNKNKAKELSSELYQVYSQEIHCLGCKTVIKLVDTEKNHILTTNCPSCKISLVPILYNMIRFRINTLTTSYYSNKKRCPQCSKNYDLDLIGFCCPSQRKAKNKPKDDIAFRLHSFLYLCKEMCELTLDIEDQKMSMLNDPQGLRKITRMIDQFLEKSEYENITNAMSKLSV